MSRPWAWTQIGAPDQGYPASTGGSRFSRHLSTHILEIAERMCDRIGIINKGELIVVGTMDELRKLGKDGQSSLEDIFLGLTGGAEETEMAEILK